MAVSLLDLFFDDDYFYKSCAEAGCTIDTALSFYKDHIKEGCNAPNDFFTKILNIYIMMLSGNVVGQKIGL